MQRLRIGVALAASVLAMSTAWAQPAKVPGQPSGQVDWPGSKQHLVDDGVPKSRGPLAFIRLERLRYVGYGNDKIGVFADIGMPDGKTYRVHKGSYAGMDFGEVGRISRDRVELKEIILKWNGDWIESAAVIERQPDTRADREWIRLMKKGEQAGHAGELKKALAAYEQAWLRAKRLGARDPRVAASLARIGEVLYTDGETGYAAYTLEAALRVRRNAFEIDAAEVAALKSRLQAIYRTHKAPQDMIDALDRNDS